MTKKLLAIPSLCAALGAQAAAAGGYLFVTFRGEATPMTEQVYFLVSEDGRKWQALNHAEPVLVSTLGEKGVRDPFIIRSHGNRGFYLIATDLSIHLTPNWERAQNAGSQSIVVWESEDLVNWSEPRLVKVAPDDAGCTWAPEAVYDPDRGEYLVFWASKTADDDYAKQRIWAAHTKDFRTFGEPFVYIDKPTTVIDTTIIRDGETYYRFTKDEKHSAITMETSKRLMEGWQDVRDFSLATLTGYEGPTCFRTGPQEEGEAEQWCLLLDWYSKGRGYQPYVTNTLGTGDFAPAKPMDFGFHPVRHGGVMPITQEEMARLLGKWGPSEAETRNPVLQGYYADPDIMYSERDRRFYMYPTSDGFDGWSGTQFRAFSSPDLVNWQDEGVILDLKKDVTWADQHAWAPCIVEKMVNGEYRYFYYFCAAQKIGVAVSDSPAGPFKDSGRALIDYKPEGVLGGQEIDPDVFHDPRSGKDYLYWGNGYMAVAELNSDMVSIDRSSIRVITPDRTFREAVHVFLRKGRYYFLWSEDDTRSPNYRVRYATSASPTGPLAIPEDNLVIAKSPEEGIYATGHNATIQVPGRDEWYIVYHRFAYPDGIAMPNGAGGYHREVCIDRMEFADDGRIIQVTPTHEGIAPVAR